VTLPSFSATKRSHTNRHYFHHKSRSVYEHTKQLWGWSMMIVHDYIHRFHIYPRERSAPMPTHEQEEHTCACPKSISSSVFRPSIASLRT
jgi:hypothetical protein